MVLVDAITVVHLIWTILALALFVLAALAAMVAKVHFVECYFDQMVLYSTIVVAVVVDELELVLVYSIIVVVKR